MNEKFINPIPRLEYKKKHTFGNPLLYIRLGDRSGNAESAHQRIIEALTLAFDPDNPDSVIPQLAGELNLGPDINTSLDFINYGNDSLVYLVSLQNGDKIERVTALVNQPRREFGLAKKEYGNLCRLSEIDPRFVVKPYAYFQHGNQELYITKYIENARCIYGGYGRWGVFDPQPRYHFADFAPEVAAAVTMSMISLLVHYYDQERDQGLAKTQLSGDDFILSQDWDMTDPASVLRNMKLIAARDMINIPFEQYLDLLRQEFAEGTRYNDRFKVNHKSEIPLSRELVESGIELGQRLSV